MNETQKQKRKYGNYCLRSANGEKKRKCHTGECVDLVYKTPGVRAIRCKKGTRKCSDQKCYPFSKKSKNPISNPFRLLKNKPESLDSNSISSSEYGEKIHPFMGEREEQDFQNQLDQQEFQDQLDQEEILSPKTKRSKRKKSKPSKRNFTSHGKYGSKRNTFSIEEEKIQPVPTPQLSSLNLPVISKKRKRTKRRSSKKSKSNTDIVYNRISPPPLERISPLSSLKELPLSPLKESPLYAETVYSSETNTSKNKPILLLENGNMEQEEEPVEEISSVEEEEPVEEISSVEEEEPVEEISSVEEEEPVEEISSVEEEEPVEEISSVEEEEEPVEEISSVEEEELSPLEPVVEEEQVLEPEIQSVELLSESSKSSSPRKKSSSPSASEISVGSIKSEGSSGGKKHSKKHNKKKSKKHNKKKYNKKSKKHGKKSSRKRSKK